MNKNMTLKQKGVSMKLILLIFIAVGISIIFSAREITKKYFSNQDQNKAAFFLKTMGVLISFGSAIVFMVK